MAAIAEQNLNIVKNSGTLARTITQQNLNETAPQLFRDTLFSTKHCEIAAVNITIRQHTWAKQLFSAIRSWQEW